MKIQEDLINQPILKRLVGIMQNGRLAHAYMFVGPVDAGKSETALMLAQLINCDRPDLNKCQPCGVCGACVKIISGRHPDVHVIQSLEDGEETIKIEQVRELLGQSRLKPYEAKKKVFIIKNVEGLTADAANALLKTLEEPTASSLLMLTTSHLEKNLSTIRSRCHRVVFLPVSKVKLASRLTTYYDVNARSAHFLAYFAEGCLGKAKRLYEEKVIEYRDEVIDGFLLSKHSEAFIKKILSDKKKLKNFLDILLLWVRDCWLIKAGAEPSSLIYADRAKEIEKFQARLSAKDLQRLTDEIVYTIKLLAENLNVKIPLLIIRELLEENK